MELKIAEGTESVQWDIIVKSSPNGTIFHLWKWLKLMEKYSVLEIFGTRFKPKLYPLFIMEREEPVGIYPFFFFKTSLINFCNSPPPNVDILYLGPLMPKIDTMKPERKGIFLHDLQVKIDRFLKNDLKSNYILINTPPGFDDCRSFKWGGYHVDPRYTYYIDLSAGTDQIWRGFNRSLRYYIEKAKKEGICVVDGTKEDACYIHDQLKERKKTSSSKEYLEEVFDVFFPDHFKVFIAKADSERLSGIITVIGTDTVSFWVGAPRHTYKGLSPNELVLWESIRWAADQGYKTFEILGADDYSLFPFKRKFNGKIIPYYQMNWLSPTLNVASSLYYSIKENSNFLREI
jgi:lipid II:glycine glycyltransferase (peptidoglycan interpeptide bridge formation enzyme)